MLFSVQIRISGRVHVPETDGRPVYLPIFRVDAANLSDLASAMDEILRFMPPSAEYAAVQTNPDDTRETTAGVGVMAGLSPAWLPTRKNRVNPSTVPTLVMEPGRWLDRDGLELDIGEAIKGLEAYAAANGIDV